MLFEYQREEKARCSISRSPRALFAAIASMGAGLMEELAWADMDGALEADDNVVWLHFDLADRRARAWIENSAHIPAAGKTLLLGSDTHMRIEVCGNGLAGIVGDLHHEFAEKFDQLDVLRLYLDNRCLISARRRPLAAIEKLRRSIGDGLKVDRPVAIIAQFLHHVTIRWAICSSNSPAMSTISKTSFSPAGFPTGFPSSPAFAALSSACAATWCRSSTR